MPLTTDEKLLTLSRDVIEGFDKVDGGIHPGFRPAHAKGILLTGVFTAFVSGHIAYARAAHPAGVHSRNRSLFGLRGHSDRCRQRSSECEPSRLRDPLPSCRT